MDFHPNVALTPTQIILVWFLLWKDYLKKGLSSKKHCAGNLLVIESENTNEKIKKS